MMLLLSITVASVAAVMCSSLALVNGIVKRKAEQDEIDGRPSPVPPPPKPPMDPEVRARSFAERRAILQAQRGLWFSGWEKMKTRDSRSQELWNHVIELDDKLMALAKEEAEASRGGDRHHHPAAESVSVGDRDVE